MWGVCDQGFYWRFSLDFEETEDRDSQFEDVCHGSDEADAGPVDGHSEKWWVDSS